MISGLSESFSDDITNKNNFWESVGGKPWKGFPIYRVITLTVSLIVLRSWLQQITLLPSRCCSLPFHSTKNKGEIGYYINRRLTFHSCFRQSSECPLSVRDPAALEGVEVLGQWQPMRRRGGGTLTQQQRTLLFYLSIACRWLCVWPSRASLLRLYSVTHHIILWVQSDIMNTELLLEIGVTQPNIFSKSFCWESAN